MLLGLVEARAMSLKSTRKRVCVMQPIGRIMADRGLSQTTALMLGSVRHLFEIVVGHSLASECEIVAVRDGKAIVAVKSAEIVRRLRTVEGFILRTFAERLDQPVVNSLAYVVRAGAGKVATVPAVAVVTEKSRAKPTAEFRAVVEGIACPDLRSSVLEWM